MASLPVPSLMCDTAQGDIGSMRWALEPHSFAHATADSVFMFSAMPTGPEETVVTSKWLVHKDAVEGVDYDVESPAPRCGRRPICRTRTCARTISAASNSSRYVPGPYSQEAELLVMRFVDWYCNEARAYVDREADDDRLGQMRPRLASVAVGGSGAS